MYGFVKLVHVLSATLLFGTGLGTAYFMWRAILSAEPVAIAHTARQVVWADWLFTTPAVIVQPLSGLALMYLLGLSWEPWILWSSALYLIAGGCWLPVLWLQFRMRDLAMDAVRMRRPLAPVFARYARAWFWLGVPAFAAMVLVFALMILKPY